MSEKSHFAALQEIRGWNTDDVICALKNNGLGECAEACKKREINGEKLLELSEMALGLWKRDLSICNIRKLAVFIQDAKMTPAKFIISNNYSNSDDAWDTDFDDDLEEENNGKTGNNIPPSTNRVKKSTRVHNTTISHEKSEKLGAKTVNRYSNSHLGDNNLSKINKDNTSPQRNKINIPTVFASGPTPEGTFKTNVSSSSVAKPPFLKANAMTQRNRREDSEEKVKPPVLSRPPGLTVKLPQSENKNSTLPKPPEFDGEGVVFREICEKLSMEHESMDEYESIDEELLHGRISRKMPDSNDLRGPMDSSKSSNMGNFSVTPTLSNSRSDKNGETSLLILPSYEAQESNDSKTPQNAGCLEMQDKKNIKYPYSSKPDIKIHVLPSALHSSLQKCSQKSDDDSFRTPNSHQHMNQESKENQSKSPILPSRNEKKREASPVPTLPVNSQNNSLRVNETRDSSVFSKVYESLTGNKALDDKQENGENELFHSEEVYESIPDNMTSYIASQSCEYSDGYLLPKSAPPTLPPKPKIIGNDMKPVINLNKTEHNDVAGSSWTLGGQKEKLQSKEKSAQDGKKNNTLPMSRHTSAYITDTHRPSVSRPLPPPPTPDGGAQRAIKIPLVQMPWYFDVDRRRAEELIRNCEDGTFVIRPSTQTPNPFTLTLKYGKRPFNISVRHRPEDGRYALGTAKPTERTFSSVEELVNHYILNELLLYSNGMQAGTVVLTSPPRNDQSSQ